MGSPNSPKGMPGGGHGLDLDERVPRRLRCDGNSRDIFCMVKGTMSDEKLVRPPILVYPHSFLPVTESFFNRINSTDLHMTAVLDDQRCTELIELANTIEVDFPHLRRGVDYLRSLTKQDRPRQCCPALKFIEAGPSAIHDLGGFELGNRPPPPKPHKLQVVFRH